MIPMSEIIALVVDRILFGGDALWDNFLVCLAFFPYADKSAHKKAFIWACGLMTMNVGMMLTYYFDYACEVCYLFFPAPQALYTFMFFSAWYLFALIYVALPANRHKVRRAVLPWIIYLFIVYSSASLGTLFTLNKLDLGFCIMGFDIPMYTLMYCPLLYYCFVRDTQAGYAHKLRHGQVQDEKSPLMLMATGDGGVFLRTQVDNAATVTFVDFDKVSIGNKIGVGAFGEVYKGKWNKLDVAVKRLLVRVNNDDTINSFLKEVSMLSKLSHPNVVQLLGVSLTPNDMYILTEFLEHGSLFDYLHIRKNKLTPALRKQVALDCARGMVYLHALNIVHRDLKTHNILLDANLKAKLCDFGMARIKAASNTMTNVGTAQYMSPETIQQDSFTEKSDVYSFGVILWEIWSERPPHYGKTPVKVIHDVTSGADSFPITDAWPHTVKSLIARCINKDPSNRPSFDQIVDELEGL
jgi:tRNA A-37 threonylcarbamoyl transferase component Bud32